MLLTHFRVISMYMNLSHCNKLLWEFHYGMYIVLHILVNLDQYQRIKFPLDKLDKSVAKLLQTWIMMTMLMTFDSRTAS